MVQINWRSVIAFVGLICLSSVVSAQMPVLPAFENPWHLEYGPAMRMAKQQHRMLLVYFRSGDDSQLRRGVDARLLGEAVQSKLANYVLCKVPHDATVTIQGEEVSLIKHAAFGELLGQPGLAMIDYRNENSPVYGHVVSVYPLSNRRQLTPQELLVLLDLPPGSITQRTMIFAVRTHPEHPASTTGELASVLASESENHSQHQANIRVQGHHQWETRFHRINSRLPTGMLAQEVCAESWPGQGLFEAAIECVHSWRQSPGHWSAVRSRQSFFGYDMKRGRNGVWYATGIFARR
ncbi:MAG: hypothetical protein RIC55_12185 [Pirellulaceae bacterium]